MHRQCMHHSASIPTYRQVGSSGWEDGKNIPGPLRAEHGSLDAFGNESFVDEIELLLVDTVDRDDWCRVNLNTGYKAET